MHILFFLSLFRINRYTIPGARKPATQTDDDPEVDRIGDTVGESAVSVARGGVERSGSAHAEPSYPKAHWHYCNVFLVISQCY